MKISRNIDEQDIRKRYFLYVDSNKEASAFAKYLEASLANKNRLQLMLDKIQMFNVLRLWLNEYYDKYLLEYFIEADDITSHVYLTVPIEFKLLDKNYEYHYEAKKDSVHYAHILSLCQLIGIPTLISSEQKYFAWDLYITN